MYRDKLKIVEEEEEEEDHEKTRTGSKETEKKPM